MEKLWYWMNHSELDKEVLLLIISNSQNGEGSFEWSLGSFNDDKFMKPVLILAEQDMHPNLGDSSQI